MAFISKMPNSPLKPRILGIRKHLIFNTNGSNIRCYSVFTVSDVLTWRYFIDFFKTLYKRTAVTKAAPYRSLIFGFSFENKVYSFSQTAVGYILANSLSRILFKLSHQGCSTYVHFIGKILCGDFFA